MTTKKPRICEHEEEYIRSILEKASFPVVMIPRTIGEQITRYLNTKKHCARCAKKK